MLIIIVIQLAIIIHLIFNNNSRLNYLKKKSLFARVISKNIIYSYVM